MSKALLERVEREMSQLETEEQKKLLEDLLYLLRFSLDDLLLLKVAEKSFAFWDNPEDSIYDKM